MAAERRANELIHRLAAEQRGIVARWQLVEAGLSRDCVEYRVKTGMLRRVHAGVYQVGPVLGTHARELAALLACKATALSHRTAARFWEMNLLQRAEEPVHVTQPPGRHCGRVAGIVAHRSALPADEVARRDGIALTTPARTLLDLSGVLGPRITERMLTHAERAGLLAEGDLDTLLHRYPRRAGSRALRWITANDSHPPLTRSEAEERLLQLIRGSGLPRPETNVKVHGIEVDCFWRQARLVIEVDGFAYHSSVGAFIRDHQRDATLTAAGIHVLRLSWHQLVRERDRTLVQLAQALARWGV